MRSPLRLPKAELEQVIAEAVEEYMRKVNRIRRGILRNVITDTYQAEGLPVPAEEELEAYIDVLEALFDAGQNDPDTILQLIKQMDDPPPVSARSNNGNKRKRKRIAPTNKT